MKRLQISDYKKMAEAHGLRFLGKVAPYTTRVSCQWVCMNCGRVLKKSYSNIKDSGVGCLCQIGRITTAEDYNRLAVTLSLKWIEEKVPYNSKEVTRWHSEVTNEDFEASYSDLAHKNPPKVAIRRHIARKS